MSYLGVEKEIIEYFTLADLGHIGETSYKIYEDLTKEFYWSIVYYEHLNSFACLLRRAEYEVDEDVMKKAFRFTSIGSQQSPKRYKAKIGSF